MSDWEVLAGGTRSPSASREREKQALSPCTTSVKCMDGVVVSHTALRRVWMIGIGRQGELEAADGLLLWYGGTEGGTGAIMGEGSRAYSSSIWITLILFRGGQGLICQNPDPKSQSPNPKFQGPAAQNAAARLRGTWEDETKPQHTGLSTVDDGNSISRSWCWCWCWCWPSSTVPGPGPSWREVWGCRIRSDGHTA